jgi:phosphate transport system substrate-binding protein
MRGISTTGPRWASRLAKLFAIGFVAVAASAFVVACGDSDDDDDGASGATTPAATSAPAISGAVAIDGSSTVFPISEAVAEEFQKVQKEVKVTVGVSGTGGGFKRFCAGETDISDASRPIKTGAGSEAETCANAKIDYIELPVAYDGLSVVVNPQNTWATCMTTAELKKLWEPEAEGKVTTWNQIRADWPNEKINLYGPGTDSGTFDYFTEAINGKEDASRGDFTASEDDNILVTGVSGDKYALGYFGLAYLIENQGKIKGVQVDGGKGCVSPTVATVESGEYAPLSRPLFIYVKKDSVTKPQVKAFVDFYLQNAGKLAGEVGYVKFPDTFYTKIKSIWTAGNTGSLFAGKSGTVASILGVQ